MTTIMNFTNVNTLLHSVCQYYYENKLVIDHQYISKICHQAKDYSVISFDIFDTILTRLFECPIDVFSYVEKLLYEQKIFLDNFAINRVKAEEEARVCASQQEFREEITVNDIYNQLAIIYPYKEKELIQAQELELTVEMQCIVPSVDNQTLIRKLKELGKKIIFVSDIYLSKKFIAKLLKEKNFTEYDELYVSAELMQTKNSGRIWQTVIKNNPNQKILHIGDNIHADIMQPKKSGIDTYHYTRLLGERRIGAQLSTNLIPFSLMSKMNYLYSNIDIEEKDKEASFWTNLGITLGGMLLQSFTSWLSEEIIKNKIEHIYFCARDAQIIYNTWNELNYNNKCNTQSSYLYLSRKVLRLPVCYIELNNHNKLSESSLSFLVNESIRHSDTYRTYFKRLNIDLNYITKTSFNKKFGTLDSEVNFNKLNELKSFLQQELLPVLKPYFYEHYKNTLAYCQQEGIFDLSKKIAIVDIGWGGTIQMAIEDLRTHMNVPNKLYGYYYGLLNQNAVGKLYKCGPMKSAFFNMFWGPEEQFLHLNSVVILENLHSANHETTIGFTKNGETHRYEPIFKEDKNQNHSIYFNKKIINFQRGIFHSISKWQKNENVYGIKKEWIKCESATAAIAQVCISPNSNEQLYLGSIRHSALYDHSYFNKLIELSIPQNQEAVRKLIHQSEWPCGLLSYWKQHKSEFKKGLYQTIQEHFNYNYYPSLIKTFLMR
jgi:predicted HAD superfamily hydrolase